MQLLTVGVCVCIGFMLVTNVVLVLQEISDMKHDKRTVEEETKKLKE